MRIVGILAIFSILLLAHKLNVFYNIEDDELYLKSYFASGAPCAECEVKLEDIDENILKVTKTDGQGEANIVIPPKLYKLTIYAGAGHGVDTLIKQDKIANIETKKEESSDGKESDFLNILLGVGLIFVLFGLLFFIKKRNA